MSTEFLQSSPAIAMQLIRCASCARLQGPSPSFQVSSFTEQTSSAFGPAYPIHIRASQSSCLSTTLSTSYAQSIQQPGWYARPQWQLRCRSSQESQGGNTLLECSSMDTTLEEGGKEENEVDVKDDGFLRSKLAVFVSGGGSNFRALHTACQKNTVYGNIVVVVSDKPGCKGCEFARENNIPVLAYPIGKHALDGISAAELVDSLRHAGVDYVLLAGYLRLLPTELVQAYPRAILNIHPALLPSFGGKGYYGAKVHEAVIHSGARYSGATIHFVDEKYDSGPILAQRVVPVLADDTPSGLAARVLKEEHELYTEAVAALCENRIFWREDGVPVIRKSWNEAEYF